MQFPRNSWIGLGAVDASDESVESPLVDLGKREIDGTSFGNNFDETAAVLRNKRLLWEQLNSGKRFPGVVSVPCEADTSTSLLVALALAAHSAGCSVVSLIAVRRFEQERPVLGKLDFQVRSAVRLQIGDQEVLDTLSELGLRTCQEVLREGARLRRQGREVKLASHPLRGLSLDAQALPSVR
jgi:hypothetical protein